MVVKLSRSEMVALLPASPSWKGSSVPATRNLAIPLEIQWQNTQGRRRSQHMLDVLCTKHIDCMHCRCGFFVFLVWKYCCPNRCRLVDQVLVIGAVHAQKQETEAVSTRAREFMRKWEYETNSSVSKSTGRVDHTTEAGLLACHT